MIIINPAIGEVEDVSRNHRSQAHGTPVLGDPIYTKCLGHNRGVNAEKKAIRHLRRLAFRVRSYGAFSMDNGRRCLQPVVPEIKTRKLGFSIVAPHNWATLNIQPETRRHQNLLIPSLLTIRSEPTPTRVSLSRCLAYRNRWAHHCIVDQQS